MLEIVENAKMTADEANEFFGQMGFDANFETHPEKITRQVPVTITESEITSVFPLKMRSSSYQKGTQPITETIEVPSLSSNSKNSYKGIKSITRRATGSFNNYSSANKGGKSAGGGSSKETKYNTSMIKRISIKKLILNYNQLMMNWKNSVSNRKINWIRINSKYKWTNTKFK